MQTLSPRINWSGIRTQWMLAILLSIVVMIGIWASVFAQGFKSSRDTDFVSVSMRANTQADYSSDPNLIFRPISLSIVEDILSDEVTSEEEAEERISDFKENMQSPIPIVNNNNGGGKQVSFILPDPEENDKKEDMEDQEISEDENVEPGDQEPSEKEEIVFDDDYDTTTPDTDDQPDALDPSDDPPGNSGDAPGQTKKDEDPSDESDQSPGNSGDAPGQNKDEDPSDEPDESPGNSGDAPGQAKKDKDPSDESDQSPGNSGDAPGQNKDEDPGQSDESPGKSSNAPGKNKDK